MGGTHKWLGAGLALSIAACKSGAPTSTAGVHRMQVQRMTGNTVSFVPAPDQLPYCLVYTQSSKGVTRQLTMTRLDLSVPCPAGGPVLGVRFRIPVDEGPVKVYTFFSDQRLQATRVTEQLTELLARPTFNTLDLRLPGKVNVDVEDFVPAEELPAVEGQTVGDGGTPPTSHDGG